MPIQWYTFHMLDKNKNPVASAHADIVFNYRKEGWHGQREHRTSARVRNGMGELTVPPFSEDEEVVSVKITVTQDDRRHSVTAGSSTVVSGSGPTIRLPW